ncbi:GreA/GreB family elongation factor [Streptomonospora sp. S1-112]|uniref:GreA/GreB family elongation factor n=1 Tax=Streptomonospora mangrovi TaxID=2883123 RepID=A0A9X3NLW9_9ACTN|nr:GreA/GreB family elongation factor [Streptomonospora mangrovi]MDA0565703.1 GreA/GreB family elongation factor [Streptomonospora mangrovi]
MASTRHWLTPATHDRLRRELDYLSGPAGDPAGAAEFGSYPDETARKARVARIQELLKDAVVGEAPPDDGVAEPGMVLTVDYGDGGEPETFLLGVRDRAAEEDITVYSPESPLGAALLGARQGERRSYRAPNGRTVTVTLLRATPYRADGAAEAARG